MANYMAFQVVIYSFWDVIPYDLLGGRISILFEIRDMAEGGRSVSPSEPGASTSRSLCGLLSHGVFQVTFCRQDDQDARIF